MTTKGESNQTRANQGLDIQAISAPLVLASNSSYWQDITATGAQNCTLPVATGLANGWSVSINVEAGSNVTVKDSAAVTLQVIVAGSTTPAYQFTLLDNGTAAGTWMIVSLDNAGSVAATRYVNTHNATSDWTDMTTFWEVAVTEATHLRGANPMIQFYEDIGAGVLVQTQPDTSTLQTTGNHTFDVPAGSGNLPDLRYAGVAVYV